MVVLCTDLNKLRKLLPKEWTCYKEHTDLDVLSSWAVNSRYPDSTARPTVGQANVALEKAKKVVESVMTDLNRKEQSL